MKIPVLLMVSGGSDSMALLESAAEYVQAENPPSKLEEEGKDETLAEKLASVLPDSQDCSLHVLHVNHLLRGAASDEDEAFVVFRCKDLNIPVEVRRVDVGALAEQQKGGIEAIARMARYELASQTLETLCEKEHATSGIILTAHTLDDRVETFFMRSLVGTGPGGLASIPRSRGQIRRPLLDTTREGLREYLRSHNPGVPDSELWHEDETNLSGDNFRSKLRISLIPVLQEIKPGFERQLAQTMDLIAAEDEMLSHRVDSLLYRVLDWDGETARIALSSILDLERPIARRLIRNILLIVDPDARLEAAQIERIVDGMTVDKFTMDVSGGIRVSSDGSVLEAKKIAY